MMIQIMNLKLEVVLINCINYHQHSSVGAAGLALVIIAELATELALSTR